MTQLRQVLCLCSLFSAGLLAESFPWRIPGNFPRPVVPLSNLMTEAKVELGRHLFYDKRMSVNGKLSCGGCHRQELAFTDGRARAEGATGETHSRSSMSLANIAYAPQLTWANPSLDSLEEQALTPMFGERPVELGLKGRESSFLRVVRGDSTYQRLFARAFPDETADRYTLDNVTKAIASFQRSIISMNSPYDRYRWEGDATALSESAKRGEIVFSSSEKGGCFQCHGGWNFSAVRFAGGPAQPLEADRNGLFLNTGAAAYEAPNRGLAEHTGRIEDIGKFKAPTLRNIAVTAPYMHDGSIATLEEVVEHYAAGGRLAHANKSQILHRLRLTGQDKRDLIEFLKSLTDETLLRNPRWSDPWKSQPQQ